jgi:hypothetical protein
MQGPRWDADTIARHNAEVAQLWESYEQGHPTRVPVLFNFSKRFYLLTPWLNAEGYTFQDYFERPEVQWEVQLATQRWIRQQVAQDQPWGLPEEWGGLTPDFQNSYESAWLGCRIEYREGEVPDTWPCLEDKSVLARLCIPDPLHDGLMGRGLAFREYFEERRQREGYCDRPVGPSGMVGGGTDGPFTIACCLRGATQLCVDLYEDPAFVHALLSFITEAAIVRVRAVGAMSGVTYPQPAWGFADDSIQLLSVAQYREFVLPYHQRLVREFSQGGPNGIHLCGDVLRLLPVVQQELNVQSFDLGFPVDLGEVRRLLGPEATLHGNLHPQVLREGPPERIRAETQRIMESGVKEGGRFIFNEGNNTAPGTPPEHFEAAYAAAREFGRY